MLNQGLFDKLLEEAGREVSGYKTLQTREPNTLRHYQLLEDAGFIVWDSKAGTPADWRLRVTAKGYAALASNIGPFAFYRNHV